MMFRIRIGGGSVLLNQSQLNELVNLLEGTTVLEDKHVGKQAGYQGYENSYIHVFTPYEVNKHFTDVTIFSDTEIDKYATLAAMRATQEQ